MMIGVVSMVLTTLLLVNTTLVHPFVEKSIGCRPRSRTTARSLFCSSPIDSSFQPLELNLLAFSTSEALFPGQTTCVTLKEGRFFDLIDDATSNHDGLIGMMLMDDDGIVMEGMPLCKITDVDVRSGFRGKVTISVEFQVVGRARLEEMKQMQPTILATCVALRDVIQMSAEELNESRSLVDRLAENLKRQSSSTAYQSAYGDAFVMLEEEYQDSEVRDLAAKSWAYMACLSPEGIGRYGSKAIASDSIHQRLDIVAKALLEEQIKNAENLMSINQDNQELNGFE
ncbi:unnamed protein product [Cylindrotheca closterium]|uniref:Lon N-terminal domain-containing protein n=1 Tax=Cylindrotheca closterium TaxID=2856 RepID=A0AAD2FIL7_9STRA|nr:unnamed protein product [Cylindrotheca closterium]